MGCLITIKSVYQIKMYHINLNYVLCLNLNHYIPTGLIILLEKYLKKYRYFILKLSQ